MAPHVDTESLLAAVHAAQRGDRAGLDMLARRYWPMLRRWALLELKDPSLAEDAAQEALVRLIRHIGTFEVSRPFEPWLHTLLRNAARDVVARRGLVMSQAADSAVDHGADRRVDLARAAETARAAFADLTPRQRQVLDLCDLQDHTSTEAAALLDIAPGTVRALLHQGRQAVRAAVMARTGDVVDLLRRTQ